MGQETDEWVQAEALWAAKTPGAPLPESTRQLIKKATLTFREQQILIESGNEFGTARKGWDEYLRSLYINYDLFALGFALDPTRMMR